MRLITILLAAALLAGCSGPSTNQAAPAPDSAPATSSVAAAPPTAGSSPAAPSSADAPSATATPSTSGSAASPAPGGSSALAAPPGSTAGGALKADGASCLAASECSSGKCEGEGCGPATPGTCVPTSRACTRDLRPYCGCDGKTFRTSGSCAGQRYAKKGECP
jgi:hypothetical protein